MLNDCSQLFFVFWRVESAVERRIFNLVVMAILDNSCLLDHDIGILRVTRHHEVMRDKSSRVFIDHDKSTKLIRLSRFATPIKLRVGLKYAEDLVRVGNRFSFVHAAMSRATDLLSKFDKPL